MRARITLIAGEAKPEMIEMDGEQTISIGRSRENNIVIPQDEHASRLHAKIYFHNGQWMIHDYGLNGTRVHKERLNHDATELEDNFEIRIGDVRFKFNILEPTPRKSSTFRLPAIEKPESSSKFGTTRMALDELTALCQFMSITVETQDAHALVKKALTAVIEQTNASLAGYLNLDPSDPLPKTVVPELAQVDVHLSRQLTRRVELEEKTVWLGCDSAMTRPEGDSLLPFHDALCVPLRSTGKPNGALHVYRSDNIFTQRDVRFCEALAGYLAHALHVLKEKRKLAFENQRLRSRTSAADDLLGDSQAMVQLRSQVERAASRPITVLIQGESGSGKELVATALHNLSPRSQGPLVVVNCASFAQSLIESELFGVDKDVATGVAERSGLFQEADEGTLFLDEIGELPLDCQAKLLRIIEGKSFRRLGGKKDIKTDVRIVAATNRDLEQEVKAGRFRQDLYFRLKVIQIQVPPLRKHPEDIPILVHYFLNKLSSECHRELTITDDAINEMKRYSWPGNVRQLRGMLESLAVMNESDCIEWDSVRRALSKDEPKLEGPPSLNLDEVERWVTEKALKQTQGNISQAANILGISRDTLYSKMKKWNIQRGDLGVA